MEFEKKQVLVLQPFGPYYDEVMGRLAQQTDLQLVECSSVREMAALGRQVGVCLMVAHCPDESLATEFVALLQFCRNEIRERRIRVIITVSNDYVFLLPRFIRAGATEVLQQPISPKRLYGKIDRFLDILPSRDKNGKLLTPRSRKPHSGDDLSDDPQITWQQPLKIRSDCWTTIEGKTQWVSGANKWSVQLIGPPPVYGEWTPCEDFSGTPPQPVEPCWEWIPNGVTDDPFIVDEGAWRYRGEKPEFKEGAWIFTGHNPKLAFVQRSEDQGSKVQGAKRILSIAEDSEHGRHAAEMIEEALRSQARVAEEQVGSGPGTASAPGYLQRVPLSQESEATEYPDTLTLSPVAAAFLVSELMRDRRLRPPRMLWRFCEYLKASCGYGQIELWMSSPMGWQCLQHTDLIDMTLRQKLESATRERLIRLEGSRAALIRDGDRKLGALLFIGAKAAVYTDFEIESYAQALSGILIGMKEDGAA